MTPLNDLKEDLKGPESIIQTLNLEIQHQSQWVNPDKSSTDPKWMQVFSQGTIHLTSQGHHKMMGQCSEMCSDDTNNEILYKK